MDWNKVLRSPPIMDPDFYKNIRAPPIMERENYKVKYNPPTVEDLKVYECVKCSRPVFTNFLTKKEMTFGEFAEGVEEEYFVFRKSCRVVVCTERVWYNCNVFHLVSCQCEEELGYFVVKYGVRGSRICLQDSFWVRCEKVKARDSSQEMKLMEYLSNQARSALCHLQKSADSRPILTPAFMSVAAQAAIEVANYILAGGVDEAHKANAASTACLEEFFPEEPERLGDTHQFGVPTPEEPQETTHSTVLSLCLGSNSEDKS